MPRPPGGSQEIVFIGTPDAVGREMLKIAGVTVNDVVFDLGSGDGRLVIAAARDFGARGVGVEIDPTLVARSRENARGAGVADRVVFRWQDLFTTDISTATVVTLYLRDDINLRLRPKLLRELRAGTRVVSHDYGMADWKPDRVVRLRGPEREHTVSLWVVPAQLGGTWQLAMPAPGIPRVGRAPVLVLRQRFQEIQGTLTIDGQAQPLATARLEGDLLAFEAGAPDSLPVSYRGRLIGDTLDGMAVVQDGPVPREVPWRARRAR
jgi:hypothetical protein